MGEKLPEFDLSRMLHDSLLPLDILISKKRSLDIAVRRRAFTNQMFRPKIEVLLEDILGGNGGVADTDFGLALMWGVRNSSGIDAAGRIELAYIGIGGPHIYSAEEIRIGYGNKSLSICPSIGILDFDQERMGTVRAQTTIKSIDKDVNIVLANLNSRINDCIYIVKR